MQCPQLIDVVCSQHSLPWKLNSCALSIRKFPLPRKQDMCSQKSPERDVWSQNLNQGFPREDEILQCLPDLSSACKLDHGQDNSAFNSSEDTDDDSARVEAPHGEDGVGGLVEDKGTTVMLCNIPCRVARSNIVNALEEGGFAGLYDFVYLPEGNGRRYRRNGNIGYCFINFRCSGDAQMFAKVFEDFQFHGFLSTKRSTVKFANLQGILETCEGHPGARARSRNERFRANVKEQCEGHVKDILEKTAGVDNGFCRDQ